MNLVLLFLKNQFQRNCSRNIRLKFKVHAFGICKIENEIHSQIRTDDTTFNEPKA